MNDLQFEDSPYLKQHADNPVAWKAWNSSTLALASELHKPLIISIGYSTCHWCHVMEHESFEDEEVAQIMNENFICIKVDREERPDIDQIYMTAATIISGQGGWPLNCFALPSGEPFHAGTYYPKEGWIALLQTVQNQFINNREKVEDYAKQLTRGIQLQETLITDQVDQTLEFSFLLKGLNEFKHSWDLEQGGMKGSPKFPLPIHYEYLMALNRFLGQEDTAHFIELSLRNMSSSGLYDQVGGGFSRYTVDALWRVPHFEKMLYDNALMLKIYALKAESDSHNVYSEIIDQSINWLEHSMLDSSGLFYSAIDADSEGEEGKYYVWTEQEIKGVLGENLEEMQEYFNLGSSTLWEKDQHILQRNWSALVRTSSISRSLLELESQRAKRVHPGIDQKCLCSWNGLMLSGLSAVFTFTDNPKAYGLLVHCADSCLDIFSNDWKLKHSFINGKARISGMLEDYVFLALGLLDAFQATGNEKYYSSSIQLCESAIDEFYDATKALFYFNSDKSLIVQTSELYDNVLPSTNASMALLLHHLGALDANSKFLEMSRLLIARMQENMSLHPASSSYWSMAHLCWTKPFYELVVIGPDASKAAKTLKFKFPFYLICFSENPSEFPLFKDRYQKGKTLIYICEKGSCQAPIEDIEQAIVFIQESMGTEFG